MKDKKSIKKDWGLIIAMDYSELKSELHRMIDSVNDEETLYQIRSILERQTEPEHDWYDDISDEMRAAIEEGIADADAGRVFSHDEAMKMIHEKYQ
jgi:predicted transcriptional regulator